ncbi:MlaE family ABC transporter permease [Niabella drilacis]|uniref:Phospholipid/cholesterol/gamma-HCH transport system permease protein n=1 Tax=Niabella drilacis (strain DSM 25811 / CCM 8410 / CCUG 62505 / LMG 26954 / E90) TaxID=1285928 RepID=A0A1G6T8Z0_NIADE|nr:ABC transporter permease [Niabella drilacis]SDD25473.1 phospholipid/cholesterol/gamma-HCH transport system permease protein [Niabella drilacis]
MEPIGQSGKPVISKRIDHFFITVYAIFGFIGRFLREVVRPPFETREFIRQCFHIGNKSLPLISLTGFITGLVFTKQSRPSLAEFGATSWLPSLISIAIVRALAPLVTALICAGRVGSSMGAELASMKVTEQIDAMEVSAINPFKYLVVTRVLACVVCLPLLMCYNGLIALAGAFVDIHLNEQTSMDTFIQNAFTNISFLDLMSSLVKVLIYGFTIGIVSCYQGFHATQGTEGVGKSANVSVVASMFLIFIEEVIIVQLVNMIR